MLPPSPTTSDANGAGTHGTGGPDLRTAVSDDLMPTPRAGDGEKGGPNQRGSSGDLMLPSAVNLLPTPQASEAAKAVSGQSSAHREDGGHQVWLTNVVHDYEQGSLLPTPAVNDMGAAYTPDQWDAWTARMKAEHNNGNGHRPSLNIEAQRLSLLPTPESADGSGGRRSAELGGVRPSGAKRAVTLASAVDHGTALLPTTTTTDARASGAADYTTGHAGTTLTDATVRQPSRWGKYAAAIARWERITRPAPEPTNITEGYLKARAKRLARLDKRPVGRRGSLKVRRQLAARFSEWMMGVPLGWITDVPDITRNEALKAAGNGVVPQQAAEALRFLLAMPTGRQIADAHEPDDLFELLAVGE